MNYGIPLQIFLGIFIPVKAKAISSMPNVYEKGEKQPTPPSIGSASWDLTDHLSKPCQATRRCGNYLSVYRDQTI